MAMARRPRSSVRPLSMRVCRAKAIVACSERARSRLNTDTVADPAPVHRQPDQNPTEQDRSRDCAVPHLALLPELPSENAAEDAEAEWNEACAETDEKRQEDDA